jgi:cyclopropane-fatty-acyl-phospholipid synthase
MNTHVSQLVSSTPQGKGGTAKPLARATKTAIKLLQHIEGGSLRLQLPDGSEMALGVGPERAILKVSDERVFRRVLAEGDIGFAESWMDGDWSSDQLAELLTLMAENRQQLARAVHGSWLPVLVHRLRHLTRINTRSGSKRNILAHYDLGNDFYKRWLDPSMTYSSAKFSPTENMTLEQAQHNKYVNLLKMLNPKPGQTILEIGCGWGGFAEVAVKEFGCKVHGVTLSPSQLEWARARAVKNGFADMAEFSLTDYRDIRGQFDHVVSIEMFEAVGERFWPSYFEQIRRCLKPGGRAVIQTITIANDRFSAYRRGTDFIQRYIFPGGMLPSPEVFERHVARAGLTVREKTSFGLDYAKTLSKWHQGFDAAWREISPLGFDQRFQRLWRFYLAYCEAGFRSGATDVYQFSLEHQPK